MRKKKSLQLYLNWRRKKKESTKSIYHLSPYEFKIDLYVNFEKSWNLEFQAK
jgi:hypothetical protein